MPRFEGVSATTTLCPILRSPKPRAELRMLASWPYMLLIKVTLILVPTFLSVMKLAHDLFDRLAALCRDVIGRAQLSQGVHGGAHHVDGIARAVALGKHVAHPGALEYRAHAAAGDHTGTVRGRLHVHPRSPMPTFDRIEQGFVLQRHGNQALSRLHHGFGDRNRHFTRLAVAKSDPAGAVTHNGERGKAELLTTLDHLGDSVHCDQLFEQVIAGHWFFYSRHMLPLRPSVRTQDRLRERPRPAP